MTAPSWPETGVLYTPERHRQLARIWLKHAGEPRYPTVARAKQMAINHEQAARLITLRLESWHHDAAGVGGAVNRC
jgi:hypothetical protein